jgi:ribokinase
MGLLDALQRRYPAARFVLTAGEDGVYYRAGGKTMHHGSYKVPVVDTTGAGDTFCGYFLACSMRGMDIAGALEYASLASSCAVGQKGAGASIPTQQQVERQKVLYQNEVKC